MIIFCRICILTVLIQGARTYAQVPITESDYYNFYINRAERFNKKHLIRLHQSYCDPFSLSDSTNAKDFFNFLDRDSLSDWVTKEDIQFMSQQIEASAAFVWDKRKLAAMEVFDTDDKLRGKKRFHSLGVPLFTLDKTKCLVIEGSYCGFNRLNRSYYCQGTKFSIYGYENNKWTRLKILTESIIVP